MKLTIRKCLGDWYVIEKQEAPGEHRTWEEPYYYEGRHVGYTLCSSARFSPNADVEGSAQELRAVADAIENRSWVSFKRCAVDARTEPVLFRSPRNSKSDGEVSREDAEDLAKQIRRLFPR